MRDAAVISAVSLERLSWRTCDWSVGRFDEMLACTINAGRRDTAAGSHAAQEIDENKARACYHFSIDVRS